MLHRFFEVSSSNEEININYILLDFIQMYAGLGQSDWAYYDVTLWSSKAIPIFIGTYNILILYIPIHRD